MTATLNQLEHVGEDRSDQMPAWLVGKNRGRNTRSGFTAHYARVLRDQYLELAVHFQSVECECRDAVGTRQRVHEQVRGMLLASRKSLEMPHPDLDATHSLLETIGRRMVHLYDQAFAQAASYGVMSRLEERCPHTYERLSKRVAPLQSGELAEAKFTELCALLDEALRVCSAREKEAMRASMLQVQRLRWIMWCVVAVFAVLLLFSPALVNDAALIGWPLKNLPLHVQLGSSSSFLCWSCAFGMMLVGAAGGMISGLLGAKHMVVSLWEYQEANIRLLLKPLIGGTTSLLVFVLLSWNVLQGVTITNVGSYLLIAFLCGFSERYFEGLLPAEETTPAHGPASHDAAASHSAH